MTAQIGICAICRFAQCENEETCALFWSLDQFWFLDFGLPDDEPEPYEDLEEKYDI